MYKAVFLGQSVSKVRRTGFLYGLLADANAIGGRETDEAQNGVCCVG